MNKNLSPQITLLTLILITGCGHNSSNTSSNTDPKPPKIHSATELSRLITSGMSVAELTNTFGIPGSDIHVAENVSVLIYSFPYDMTKEGTHLSGFTVQIKNGSVVQWSPSTAVVGPKMFQGPGESGPEISYGELTFELFTLTDSMTNILKTIELVGSVDTSALGTSSDLVFKAQVFAGAIDSNLTNKPIRLIVQNQDVSKLSELTKKNLGRPILIAIQNKVIAAPVITVPITYRQFQFTARDASFLKNPIP